uniref:Floricaula/leafy-like transcription factor n=1 Tax=Brassica napus TaxID=3708 RepID=A0A1D6YYE1_BRANA|nr:truncated LEAFY protein [Brassica napus]
MDPEGFTSGLFRWNPTRAMVQQPPPPVPPPPQQQPPATPQTAAFGMRLGGLEGLFGPYGVRFYTAAKIAELGFTASTLVGMKDEELEDMMNSLSHIFVGSLLVGERYRCQSPPVRAERRRLLEEEEEEVLLDAVICYSPPQVIPALITLLMLSLKKMIGQGYQRSQCIS